MKSPRKQMPRRTALGLALVAIPAIWTGARAQAPAVRRATPSQTEGPYYPVRLPDDSDADLLRNGRLNLHNREILQSPYFYLEQNDIIYVEPLKAKVGDTADATTKYLQWALPIVSVITLLATLFVK